MAPAEALRRIIYALHAPPAPLPADTDALASYYRTLVTGRRMLILLDNARDTDQVRALLPGTPTALVVITSRKTLASLVAVEAAQAFPLDLLTGAEARELLTQRLGSVRVAAEPDAIDELIALCARLPIALAIVAANAATRPRTPLAAIAKQLRDAQDRLAALSTGDGSNTDLSAVFASSYQALTEPAARLFRLLGLHPGPDISVRAAGSLAALRADRADQALRELVAAHLIVEHLPDRYTFHDLMRVYATELVLRSESMQDRRAAARRMLDHYLHTAYAATMLMHSSRDPIALASPHPDCDPETPADDERAIAWFAAEHQVLLAVIRHAAATGLDEPAGELAWAFADFLDRGGFWHDQATVQHIALDAARRRSDPAAQAFAHRMLGAVHIRLGDADRAHHHLQHAFSLYREIRDHAGQAHTHLTWVLVWPQSGHDEALRHARQALYLYRRAGHRKGEANALNSCGWYLAQLGNASRALAYCQQALTLLQELGDIDGEAAAWDSLGYVHHVGGSYAQAIPAYHHAIDMNRSIGNRYDEAEVLAHLGDSYEAVGDIDAARHAYRQAIAVLTELNHSNAGRVEARLEGLGAGFRDDDSHDRHHGEREAART